MKIHVTALLSILFLSLPARGQTRPTVLIHGEGNISITSAGIGSAGIVGNGTVIGSSSHRSTVNKHDQTMEMAQDFLRFCPSVELTLNAGAPADYVVQLNREGSATIFGELGRSQIMVVNGLDSPIFVGKRATVENAVKSACDAIAADWQAHGRLKKPMPVAVPSPAPSPAPAAPIATSPVATPPPSSEPSATPTPKPADIAVVMMTTAAAEKRCKPETLASVLSDTTAYLTSKGMKLACFIHEGTTRCGSEAFRAA